MSELAIPRFEDENPFLNVGLPTVEELSADFEYLLSRSENPTIRIKDAMDYSEHLRTIAGMREIATMTLESARKQNSSKILLGALSAIAQNWVYRSEQSKRVPHDTRINTLKGLIATKKELQGHIEDYILLNFESNGYSLYPKLDELFERARELVYGSKTAPNGGSQGNSGLFGLLAELKVVSALRSHEWPQATYSTIDQDISGIDVIVPRPDSTASGIQVKCLPDEITKMHIVGSKIPTVYVPMNPHHNNPLQMSERDATTINTYVYNVPVLPTKLAA